jgi:hypothetical protein
MRSNHHIAGDPTRVARSKRKNQDSEQVEPVLDSRGCTTEREDEGRKRPAAYSQRFVR